MSQTVEELLTSTLAELRARMCSGGDGLNAFADAIRTENRMSWIGVRHKAGTALAAMG